MIDEEFIHFVGRIFPSIAPEDQKRAVEAARKNPPTAGDLFAVALPPKICQGDIVSELSFLERGPDDRVRSARLPGMLLSHSCDFDTGTYITFAPVLPFRDFARNAGLAGYLRNNQVLDRLFLPDVSGFGERIVDFSLAQPFAVSQVAQRVASDATFRQASFTLVGYYFFMAKLALHLMRPRPADEARVLDGRTLNRQQRLKLGVNELKSASRLLWSAVLPRSAEAALTNKRGKR